MYAARAGTMILRSYPAVRVDVCRCLCVPKIGVPPVRVGPERPAGLPGRVLPVTGSGPDPKTAGFFGPGTRLPEYSGTRLKRVPGYPFSNVFPWSACLAITSGRPSNTQQTTQRNTPTVPTSY